MARLACRVGRVLVRKLVLRGYNVRVLARNQAQVMGILPSSVGIVEGDVSSPASLREAVEGIDKASRCAHRHGITACPALPACQTGTGCRARLFAEQLHGMVIFSQQLHYSECAKPDGAHADCVLCES